MAYSSEHIAAIDSGAHIRLRPQLYFGSMYDSGNLNDFIFEFLCHAFDEYFDGNCKSIEIRVKEKAFEISYDAGMSLETTLHGTSKAESIMTQMFVCSNAKKHLEVGQEFCQLGIMTLNAASEYCVLETVSEGKSGKFRFENGSTVSSEISGSTASQSTIFEVMPNYGLFPKLGFDLGQLKSKAAEIEAKLPGLSIAISEETKSA